MKKGYKLVLVNNYEDLEKADMEHLIDDKLVTLQDIKGAYVDDGKEREYEPSGKEVWIKFISQVDRYVDLVDTVAEIDRKGELYISAEDMEKLF